MIGLALGWRLVPRGQVGAAPALDWRGYACIGAGLPLLVYALTRWGSTGSVTTPSVLVPLILGALALATFGMRTRNRAHPLMDLRLYRNPVYAAASGATTFTGAVLFGAGLVFALYFQILHGGSVVTTGLLLLSLGAGTALVLPLSGRLTDRYGGGIVSVWGTLLSVAALIPFAFLSAGANPILFQGLLVLLGMATALAAVPPGI